MKQGDPEYLFRIATQYGASWGLSGAFPDHHEAFPNPRLPPTSQGREPALASEQAKALDNWRLEEDLEAIRKRGGQRVDTACGARPPKA